MNYELYMRAALSEARWHARLGSAPTALSLSSTRPWSPAGAMTCVASGDPTAHAVIIAVREAATAVGPPLAGGDHRLLCRRTLRDVCRGAPAVRRRRRRLRAARSLQGACMSALNARRGSRAAASPVGRFGHPSRRCRRAASRPAAGGLRALAYPRRGRGRVGRQGFARLSPDPERCPSGLRCRSRKAVCESTVGSNPTLSATPRPVMRPIRGEVA